MFVRVRFLPRMQIELLQFLFPTSLALYPKLISITVYNLCSLQKWWIARLNWEPPSNYSHNLSTQRQGDRVTTLHMGKDWIILYIHICNPVQQLLIGDWHTADDSRNPKQAPWMHKALQITGETTNLDWWVYRISEPSTVAICSRYGIFTYILLKFMTSVGKYSIPMEHLGYSSQTPRRL